LDINPSLPQQRRDHRFFKTCGKKDAPVIVSWIVAGHQLGGAAAALGAGEVRNITGSYLIAFVASGLACLMASLLVLRIARRPTLAASPA
jgi:hypothetical protein